MRAHCANIINGGKLNDDVPQPQFLADPSHRVKVMSKPLFAMATKTKDPTKLKMIDAMRMKKYTRCYITQNRQGNVQNLCPPPSHLSSISLTNTLSAIPLGVTRKKLENRYTKL